MCTLEWPIFFRFKLSAGVRQGGLLSPVLFAVYMDPLILKLRKLTVGCKIVDHFYGCLRNYADDIMLLAHSVNAMRRMLSVCEEFAADLDIKFNTSKSVAMRVGKRFNVHCAPLILAGTTLKFVSTVRYLGVYLMVQNGNCLLIT